MRSVIGMQNAFAACRVAAENCHAERVDDQFGPMWSAIDQPTISRERVHNGRAVQFPFAVGCSVMSVSHSRSGPATVNGGDQVLPSAAGHQVRRPSAPVDALDAGLAHQPGHPLAVHLHAQAQRSSAWTRGDP